MSIEEIKKLREQTGAGVMDAKTALEEAGGDVQKAAEILKEKGIKKAEKKAKRDIKAGKVFSYVHGEGRVGALVKLGCETDFVAKNEEFINLGKELAMQVVAMNPKDVEELLGQAYIRDASKTVKDLITQVIAKTGENVTIEQLSRLEIN